MRTNFFNFEEKGIAYTFFQLYSIYDSVLCVFEAVGVVLFDKRLNAIFPNMSPPEETVKFVKSAKGVMAGMEKMIFEPPIYKFFKTKAFKEFENDVEYVYK